MAAIVGIHGIAQQFQGGYQLGSVWYNAVRDGLVAAGHGPIAEALAPANVRVVFFGDLFRPPGTMSVQEPPAFRQQTFSAVQNGICWPSCTRLP